MDPRYDKARHYLVEKAEHALTRSRFWFSQLALIQALTLFSLPEAPDEPLPVSGPGSDPQGLVDHWLSLAGSDVPRGPGRGTGDIHPFVAATGRLCAAALATRHPERLCWVDEREITSRVGSCSMQEMDENFCARQVDLLALRYRHRARAQWQAVPLEELRALWQRMSEHMLPACRK